MQHTEHSDDLQTQHRTWISLFAWVGLALVLAVLTGFAVWAALTTEHLTTTARTDVKLNELYQQARYSVGAEESLERKYRLEPSPEVFADHRAAAATPQNSLEEIGRRGSARDRSLTEKLLAVHVTYLSGTKEMFDAVDARRPAKVLYFDHHIVDPVFGFIERTVDREAGKRHQEVLNEMADLDRTQHRVVTSTPFVFAIGIVLLSLFMFILRGLMANALHRTQSALSETQQQLVQSAKLASLGTLSAGVAHELNQPLAIIRGVTQQLHDEPGLPEDVLADLDLIEGQTGRMSKIVNHLRSFSRIGAQQMDNVHIDDVIENCFILVGAQLKAHEITVDLQLDATDHTIQGDANELEQVFLNLMTNACDALEGNSDAHLTISSHYQSNHLVVEFRDNGTGIPDEIAKRIFDPFFTTKEVGRGTGLGLSISHGIIEKHSGTIEVHNDGGAVFTITLPVLEEQSSSRILQSA